MNNRELIKELLNLSDEALLMLGRVGMVAHGRKVAEYYANGGEIEVKAMSVSGKWRQAHGPNFTAAGVGYRAKRKMIRVNGIEVPAPESVAPEFGTTFYMPDLGPLVGIFAISAVWYESDLDMHRLAGGVLYLNKEDAEARARAMMKFEVVE